MGDIRKKKLVRACVFALSLMLSFSMFSFGGDTAYAAAKTPAKVKTVKLSKKTTETLAVKWTKAKSAKQYQVAWKKAGAKKFTMAKTKSLTYTIKGLASGSDYNIKVRGVNGKKNGKWSKTYKWKTSGVNYQKASNESKVKVKATDSQITITIKSLGKSGNGTLYSTNANEYLTGDGIKGIVKKNVSGTKVGTFALNKSKTFKIDRYTDSGYDRLYDKYYIVQNKKIVKGPIYATEIAADRSKVELKVPSKKGLIDELDDQCFEVMDDLGCNWTAMNIDFTNLVLANETADGTPIDNSGAYADTIVVNGKIYYIDKGYIDRLDSRVSRYTDMGVNVVGIVVSFVSSEEWGNYPRALKYIDDARWTNGFNTSTASGRDYFIACMEYLADRYSSGEHGLICDYVIGNEIDYAYDWNEILPNKSKNGKALPPRNGNKQLRSGEIEVRASFDVFMEEYSRVLRLANLAVKKYASGIKVGVSISKEWSKSRCEIGKEDPAKSKKYDSYRPRDIIYWLNYYSKKSGDYDWTITPHNYPLTEDGNAAAYETSNPKKMTISGDPETTIRITQHNMEVMQLFLNRSYLKFSGKVREIYLTENGCSSGTKVGTPSSTLQKQQAAAVAQLYYRAASLPSVKAIIYYKMKDRAEEGATAFKLGLLDTTGAKKQSYDVWKYIDTSKSFSVTKKYLSSISFKKNGKEYSTKKGNIKSFKDVMPIVSSSFSWKSTFKSLWDKGKLTPVSLAAAQGLAAEEMEEFSQDAELPAGGDADTLNENEETQGQEGITTDESSPEPSDEEPSPDAVEAEE